MTTLTILIELSQDLINTESGQEEAATVPTNNDFNPNFKGIINESYFLYDKIDLRKDTFITAIKKNFSLRFDQLLQQNIRKGNI